MTISQFLLSMKLTHVLIISVGFTISILIMYGFMTNDIAQKDDIKLFRTQRVSI